MSVADKLSALATAAAEAAAAMRGVPVDAAPPAAAMRGVPVDAVPPAAAPYISPGWLAAPQMSARNAVPPPAAAVVPSAAAPFSPRGWLAVRPGSMSAEAKAAMVAKRVATVAARGRHGAEVRAAMDISDEAVDREQSEILARAEAEDAAREAAEEVARRDSAEAYAASRARVADAIAAHRAEAAAPGAAARAEAAAAAAKAAAAAAAAAELAGEAGWTRIGDEHTTHKLPEGTRVKFGKGDKWIEKVVGPEGTIAATARSEDFGSDPAPGVFKEIWRRTGGRRRKTRRRKTRHHRRSKTSKRA